MLKYRCTDIIHVGTFKKKYNHVLSCVKYTKKKKEKHRRFKETVYK